MIAILSKTVDAAIAGEFFELFKTPWEFYRTGGVYDVIISDDPAAALINSRLVILFTVGPRKGEVPQAGIEFSGTLLKTENVTFPVYCGSTKVSGEIPFIISISRGETVGARCIEAAKIVLHLGFNFFTEMQYLLSKGQSLEFADYPVLEIHIDNLRRWILEAGVPLVEIPPVPWGYRFFACLSHDVDNGGIRNHGLDHTLAGFVYRALIGSVARFLKGDLSLKMLIQNWRALAALPLVKLGLAEDFWLTFRKYTQIENRARSTFFLVPFRDRPGKLGDERFAPAFRAVKYEVSGLRSEIDHLLENGCEVAVHGIDSWADLSRGKQEISKIKSMTRSSKIGVRMHWLYFGQQSPRLLEEAGFDYDSTCGFNEKAGYKAGTLQVFMPPGAQTLLELPLHIMDTALFYPDRMNLRISESAKVIKGFAQQAAEFGGVLTLNWHDRSIAPERLWGAVYQDALKELNSQGARFSTASNVVEWFRNRRGTVFHGVVCNSTSVRVALAGDRIKHSEGLILRVYPAHASLPFNQTESTVARRYKDVPIAGRTVVEVPF